MLNELKQFAVKVIGSPSNQFHVTRLQLTGLYAGILLAVLVISSVITHSIFSSRLEYRFRHRLLPPPPAVVETDIVDMNTQLRTEAQEELLRTLLIVDGVLFVGGVGLSYFLAGLTLRPIQEAYDRQRQFLSDASHELRTPLAILQTDLENELADTKLKRDDRDDAESHLEEVKRMSSIVKDLLLLSRLDGATPAALPRGPMDVQPVLATAVERLKHYAAKHDVELTFAKSGPQKPLTIQADAEHILRAVSNLIKNAVDYNKPHGLVTIASRQTAKDIVITVADTGIGIPEGEVPRLFDRFYRVDQSRSRQAGGSGLGLSIVHSIVAAYGGTVAIESAPDKGTTVTLTFPHEDASASQ